MPVIMKDGEGGYPCFEKNKDILKVRVAYVWLGMLVWIFLILATEFKKSEELESYFREYSYWRDNHGPLESPFQKGGVWNTQR